MVTCRASFRRISVEIIRSCLHVKTGEWNEYIQQMFNLLLTFLGIGKPRLFQGSVCKYCRECNDPAIMLELIGTFPRFPLSLLFLTKGSNRYWCSAVLPQLESLHTGLARFSRSRLALFYLSKCRCVHMRGRASPVTEISLFATEITVTEMKLKFPLWTLRLGDRDETF